MSQASTVKQSRGMMSSNSTNGEPAGEGMMPMTINEVAQAVHGRLVGVGVDSVGSEGLAGAVGSSGSQPMMLTGVESDSRRITPGAVFVAIAGERVDGHDFVRMAASRGALAALVEHEVDDAGDIAQIVVPNSIKALGLLARHNIDRRRAIGDDFSIIGITGSVGKTTTKDILKSLLSNLGSTVAPVGSFNNDIGLPLTALKVNASTRFFVAEMGANHVGEIAGLTRIAPPDVAVVLKVGVAHLGEFGSVERIARAKSEIVQGLVPNGVAVLNADDERVAAMRNLAPGTVLWFGLNGCAENAKTPMMSADQIDVNSFDQPKFTLVDSEGDRARTHLELSGGHNVINALAAATVARFFGMGFEAIADGLSKVSQISAHRMAISQRVRPDGSRFVLIDDSFNANPDSMRAGLDGLARWRGAASDSEEGTVDRLAVLGCMLELGDEELTLHRQIGQTAVELGLDGIIVVGNADDSHGQSLAEALYTGAMDAVDHREQAESDSTTQSGGGLGTNDGASLPIRPVVRLARDVDEAAELVNAWKPRHSGMAVLLKGSHASGVCELADVWPSEPLAVSNSNAGRTVSESFDKGREA
jgi:UDP-N-acetylmuramoyl-tripeptide--D-alanyl-D-alanine ligase